MRCPTHDQLLHHHLRCFHNMRCAPTWEDALHHQHLADAAARAAEAHTLSCSACNLHHHHAATAPAWQSGLY